MITAEELIRLPYPRDLTEAGIVYARRAVLDQPVVAGHRPYDAFRRAAASAALGLAFRRYLTDGDIPFGVQRPAPFLDPDRYDLRLGNNTCELKTYLISRSSEWTALEQDPQLILDAPALVPVDRHVTDTVRPNDVYVFAFVGAGIADGTAGRQGGGAAPDEFWLHFLPPAWHRAPGTVPLGPISLKTADAAGIALELDGTDVSGAPTIQSIELAGNERLALGNAMVALRHVSTRLRPTERLGIHAPARRLRHVVEPMDWHNLWLDGWGMLVVGWMRREEFRARARLMPPGSRVPQFDRTRLRNLAVTISQLRPIASLPGIA